MAFTLLDVAQAVGGGSTATDRQPLVRAGTTFVKRQVPKQKRLRSTATRLTRPGPSALDQKTLPPTLDYPLRAEVPGGELSASPL